MVLLVANSLAAWSWADTWIVTGLGFGIVVVLLICLVFILQAFGWTMQRAMAPKQEKPQPKPSTQSTQNTQSAPKAQKAPAAPSEPEKAAIAMALTASADDEIAAIAYALHLARNSRHDLPTAMISLHPHETAWNTKSVGMNNQGF